MYIILYTPHDMVDIIIFHMSIMYITHNIIIHNRFSIDMNDLFLKRLPIIKIMSKRSFSA